MIPMLSRRSVAALVLLGSALALDATAQPLATAPPESMGMSSERLKRLDAVVQRYVDDGRIAGVVTLVARNGRVVHLKGYGKADVERGTPMAPDALFRLASMSKAVTSVAVMILVEEGAVLLNDPVSKFIPSFKQTFVAVPPPAGSPEGARVGTVPARRPITIRDLLTHTAGISYGDGPAQAEYKAARVQGWYFADKDEPLAAVIDRLAALPFDAQPGERFVYGFNSDILGRVVEVASGTSLDEFYRRRIFEPLRMTESYFFVPPDKASRLATVYAARPDGTIARAPDHGREAQGEYVEGPRKCFSGGAGLVATTTDYARFLQMLLNGGELDGVRVLSPASVAAMTANQVGALYSDGNLGFGLGFEVIEHLGRAGRLGAQGEFSWGGAYYTRYFVDPRDGVVALFMAQLLPSNNLDLQNKFRSLVYQAITEPGRALGSSPPPRAKTPHPAARPATAPTP